MYRLFLIRVRFYKISGFGCAKDNCSAKDNFVLSEMAQVW